MSRLLPSRRRLLNGTLSGHQETIGCMKVALVHDWLNQVGGAENVLEVLARMFPGAPVFTSIYAPRRMPPAYRSWDIRPTFMQHLPGVMNHHQAYMPVYPLAFTTVGPAQGTTWC